MGLKREISKLTQSSAETAAVDDELLRLLVDVLARVHALFFPWRRQVPTDIRQLLAYPEITQRQANYLAGNRGVELKAAGQRQWKDAHYQRQQLADLGWVVFTRSKGQVTSLLLTPQGEATANAVIGNMPSLLDSLPYLLRIKKNIKRLPWFIDGPWVSESKLFNQELHGNPADWNYLTERMLPALIRGMVAATFDTQGRVFYRPVDGADWPGELPRSYEPVKEWALDTYLENYNKERLSLEQIEQSGNEVHIPLPATSFGNCLCSPTPQLRD